MHTKTCPYLTNMHTNIVQTCIPKPIQKSIQHASNTMHLPNIHDHLHKQHFNICKSNLHDPNLSKSIQICLNMSINYFPQTKSPTPVTYKLSKKHYIPKNKPLQNRPHTNHYIPKNKSMSKKKPSMLPFWPFLFQL
jgi:hypothetical protein